MGSENYYETFKFGDFIERVDVANWFWIGIHKYGRLRYHRLLTFKILIKVRNHEFTRIQIICIFKKIGLIQLKIGPSIKCNNGYLICLNWCFQCFMCANYMICKETLTERKIEQRYIRTMIYSGSQLRAWLSPGLQY